MALQDIVNGPWAITPEMHAEIQGIYARHMRGEKIDLASLEARIGAPLNNTRQEYQVENGVAIIQVQGALAKRMNLMSRISGGSSYQVIEQQIQAALEDSSVESIALDIDSPGGTVDGAFELAHFIRRAAQVKPIESFSDGMIASAAYLIAAATNKITLLAPGTTNPVGSIGAMRNHEFRQKDGVQTTRIVSGKYKALGDTSHALTDDDKAHMQAEIDYVATQFINDVAAWRGISAEKIASFEARLFTGQQAIDAGLVDGVSTLGDLLSTIADGASALSETAIKENQTMSDKPDISLTLDKFKADYPAIYQQALEEGQKLGMEAGATQERERIKSVQEQCFAIPGNEKLAAELMFDGKTSGPEAAIKVLASEKSKLAQIGQQMHEDAPAPIEASEPNTAPAATDNAEDTWAKDTALQQEFGGDKEAYLAYVQANNAGLVRSNLKAGGK